MKKIIATAVVLFFAAVVVLSCFTIIPTGFTGVKVTFRQVSDKAVTPGFTFKIPFVQSIVKVNNKQQDCIINDQIWAETKDRTAIKYEGITVTYQIQPDRASWLVANVTDYKNSLITNAIVSSAIKTASKELNDTDSTNRGKIEPLAQEKLQAILDSKFGQNAVYINRVTITNVDFDESYNQAIADKQNAQLIYEKQAIENKAAIEKAEADAQVKKKAAEGEAEAIKIKADAEAEANNKIAESLTDEILRNKYFDTWDGKLPTVVGDSSMILPEEFLAGTN